MVRRRCLGCAAMIPAGSYCERCAERRTRERERARGQRRTSYERLAWPALVKRRDGWRCAVPGCATPRDRIQAHHIVPLAAGGASVIENGVTLCHRHHMEAHARLRDGAGAA